MAPNRVQILNLYRSLLRESQNFSAYNYREYALRRVRDAFRSKKAITDPSSVAKDYEYGLEQLEVVKRQTLLGRSYQAANLVIERKSANQLN